jgi:hypothetical protein
MDGTKSVAPTGAVSLGSPEEGGDFDIRILRNELFASGEKGKVSVEIPCASIVR